MRVFVCVLLAVLLCRPACEAAFTLPIRGPLTELQVQLATIALHAPGRVGIEIKDLATGLTSSINPYADMPAASTIKIPVMVEVFRQMSLGGIGLNDVLHLQPGDRDWGWGSLASARTGTPYTVDQLLRLMITDSDNTATNMLIRRVGRWRINATMRRMGLHHTVLGDYIRSNGDIRSLRSSPADMVSLLASIAREQLIDAWSCREMIAILEGQRHNTLIPAPLPRGLLIAHKTGTLHDTLNDVGIVYLGSQPYVIAVMTTNLPSLGIGRRFIRNVSRLAYGAFTRLAQRREVSEPPNVNNPAPAVAPPEVPVWDPATAGSPAAPPALDVPIPEQPPAALPPQPDPATGS